MGTRFERGVSMHKRIAGLVMCFVVALPLAAQVDRASVGGTVTDASGAVVKGAKVGAESSGTGFQRWTVTQYGAGYYAVFFADPDGVKLEYVHYTGASL